MSLLSEVLIVGGVAMDLGVLSHAHNAESIMQIREEVEAKQDDEHLPEQYPLRRLIGLLPDRRWSQGTR